MSSINTSPIANLLSDIKPHKSLIGIVAAGIAGSALAWAAISKHSYDNEVELGEAKHVQKLLALSEQPGMAEQNLQQLAKFRSGNWRFYLTKSSLEKLNQKGIKLHRIIETENLARFASIALTQAIVPANVDTLVSRLQASANATAFKYLDPAAQNSINQKLLQASALQKDIREKKEEEERLAKEAEAQRVRAKESEERVAFLVEYIEKQRAQGSTNDQVRNLIMETSSFAIGIPGTTNQERELALRRALGSARVEPPVEPPTETRDSSSSVYQLGPRGGCFYWSGNSKIYVDRANCN